MRQKIATGKSTVHKKLRMLPEIPVNLLFSGLPRFVYINMAGKYDTVLLLDHLAYPSVVLVSYSDDYMK
jgi:hypothetical protein